MTLEERLSELMLRGGMLTVISNMDEELIDDEFFVAVGVAAHDLPDGDKGIIKAVGADGVNPVWLTKIVIQKGDMIMIGLVNSTPFGREDDEGEDEPYH